MAGKLIRGAAVRMLRLGRACAAARRAEWRNFLSEDRPMASGKGKRSRGRRGRGERRGAGGQQRSDERVIQGRDFAGSSIAATEREQTRDVQAGDMVQEPRPDESVDTPAPFRHDEEIGES
jgi:hypothetical protein